MRECVRTHAWHETRAFSSAVKVTGGTLVFLAGMTPVDEQRRLVGPGNFDQQVGQVWENMRLAVEKAGGQLSDVVTMTVFLTDLGHGNRFIELRRQKFGRDFPASALIGINQLAMPGMLIEIQAIAAIP
ncbi:MAG TPA: RidA family protein [Methylomirabilota bacterium]|nr:RidA family protein [Methylomirabilota bacterium]